MIMLRWIVVSAAVLLAGVIGTAAVAQEPAEEWVACGASGWLYRVEGYVTGHDDVRMTLRRHLTYTQHLMEVRNGDGKMDYVGDIPDGVRRLFGQYDLSGDVVRRYVTTPEYLEDELDRIGPGIYRGNTGEVQGVVRGVEQRSQQVHVLVGTKGYSTMAETTEEWWAYRCKPAERPSSP